MTCTAAWIQSRQSVVSPKAIIQAVDAGVEHHGAAVQVTTPSHCSVGHVGNVNSHRTEKLFHNVLLLFTLLALVFVTMHLLAAAVEILKNLTVELKVIQSDFYIKLHS